MLKYMLVFPSQGPQEAAFVMWYLLVFLPSRLHWDFCLYDTLDVNLIKKLCYKNVQTYISIERILKYSPTPMYPLCFNNYQLMANSDSSISVAH